MSPQWPAQSLAPSPSQAWLPRASGTAATGTVRGQTTRVDVTTSGHVASHSPNGNPQTTPGAAGILTTTTGDELNRLFDRTPAGNDCQADERDVGPAVSTRVAESSLDRDSPGTPWHPIAQNHPSSDCFPLATTGPIEAGRAVKSA